MVSNNFVITKQAKIDIEQAFDYIVNEFGDKFAVKKLYDELFDTIQRICIFPENGALVDNEIIRHRNSMDKAYTFLIVSTFKNNQNR